MGCWGESEERKEGVHNDSLVGVNESLQLSKVDGREVIVMRRETKVLKTEVLLWLGMN